MNLERDLHLGSSLYYARTTICIWLDLFRFTSR